MIFDPFPVFLPSEYRVKFATDAWERREAPHCGARCSCVEQGIFADEDRDSIDEVAIPIVAISSFRRRLAGGCRHGPNPSDRARVWWGSRLAVASDYRRIGAPRSALIRLAVSSAHAMGCQRFFAHVQSQNAILFRRLHWDTIDELKIHGRPHHFMQANLAHYPPITDAEPEFYHCRKKAA